MNVKLSLAACALAACATCSAGVKIGTVDMMLLVRNHSSYETNKEMLSGMEKDLRARMDSLKEQLEELQEEGRKLADELKNPMLAASAKEESEKKIAGVQRKFIQLQRKAAEEAEDGRRKLAETEAMLLKSQAGDLKKRIAEYGDKNGFDLIVDSAAAIYSSSGMDVTDAVLKAMGVDPKAARAKEKNEGK